MTEYQANVVVLAIGYICITCHVVAVLKLSWERIFELFLDGRVADSEHGNEHREQDNDNEIEEEEDLQIKGNLEEHLDNMSEHLNNTHLLERPNDREGNHDDHDQLRYEILRQRQHVANSHENGTQHIEQLGIVANVREVLAWSFSLNTHSLVHHWIQQANQQDESEDTLRVIQ